MIDIAREAGVTPSTVSLALSNHPRIAAATKSRIHKICEQLGYYPDPAARALAHRAAENGESHYLGTLALLESEKRFQFANQFPDFKQWNQQLTDICLRAGYRLEHFVVGPTSGNQHALNRILQARGIRGLLVYGCHQNVQCWEIDWNRYATVTYGNASHERFAHNIISNSYQDVYDAVVNLRSRGYKRPGFFTTTPYFDQGEVAFSYAFEGWGKNRKNSKLILEQPLKQNDQREKFMAWFRHYAPDVIVTNYDAEMFNIFSAEGVRVPEDVGCLYLDVWPSMRHLSGLFQFRDAVYQIMVDLLHGMLMRHEFGTPAQPYCVQIPSLWNEGKTLRPSPSA